MILNEENSKTVVVDKDNTRETTGSIGFIIQRSDGVRLKDPVYIPKSQIIKITKRDNRYTEYEIKKWILDKKLLPGFSIVEY